MYCIRIVLHIILALQNPNACLNDVDPDADPTKKYHLVLAASKENKIKLANNIPMDYENRNPNAKDTSYDAYDELLTQEEIQDHVDKINRLLALERIEHCVKSRDIEALNYALNGKHLSLAAPIKTSLISKYLKEIETIMNQARFDFLRREVVENAIVRINSTAKQSSSVNLIREEAVKKVNMALEMGDPEQLVQALKVILIILLLKFFKNEMNNFLI